MYPNQSHTQTDSSTSATAQSLESLPVDQTTDQKQRRLVFKHQGQFLLLDLKGGMAAKNGAGLGLYVNDTRFLSQWDITLADEPLHFLTADAEEGYAGVLHYSHRSFAVLAPDAPSGAVLPDSLSVRRNIVVDEEPLVYETIHIQNHSEKRIATTLSIAFAADFADMFEVRGDKRKKRGYLLPGRATTTGATLRYLGLDNILRSTRVSFSGTKPTALTDRRADFKVDLLPQQSMVIKARIALSEKEHDRPLSGEVEHRPVSNHGRRFDFARARSGDPLLRARRAYKSWIAGTARLETDNSDLNRLIDRSYRDIYLLRQRGARGDAIAAGVPWFAVPFGRDSLIAGLQTLQFMPAVSRDVLKFLASYQGKNYDEATCEKPGRIMHELRPGEMAGLGEIVFRPYYGTVDATQLWLMLFARYVEWTGDLAFARELWPNAMAALNYLERERPGAGRKAKGVSDRFFTYGGSGALSNQGWKDSGNCIVYKDGKLARGPIAVCEAQGYVYAAWNELAVVAARLGKDRTAARLSNLAKAFKRDFNQAFWVESMNMVALALDGNGAPCDVVASNAGHLLGTGILSAEREKLVADRLMREDMFSGWGIRTLAASEAAFQPMDYQVGAVWPHDNGIIAHGMSRIGESASAHRVFKAMLDVAVAQSDMRLPELFAGFDREEGDQQPVPYQVACIPQLWAAGCVFHMLAGLTGLSFDAAGKTLTVTKPDLPAWLNHLKISGLRLGAAHGDEAMPEVTLVFNRTPSGKTTVEIERVSGNVRCFVEH